MAEAHKRPAVVREIEPAEIVLELTQQEANELRTLLGDVAISGKNEILHIYEALYSLTDRISDSSFFKRREGCFGFDEQPLTPQMYRFGDDGW